MNKYVIVSFIEQNIPALFLPSAWPLHVTLVRPFFSLQKQDGMITMLSQLCAERAPIATKGTSRALFGRHRNVPVAELDNTTELAQLHKDLLWAGKEWMEFKTQEFGQFRPHVTDQKSGTISVGENIVLQSLSLLMWQNDSWNVIVTLPFLVRA